MHAECKPQVLGAAGCLAGRRLPCSRQGRRERAHPLDLGELQCVPELVIVCRVRELSIPAGQGRGGGDTLSARSTRDMQVASC